MCIFLSVPLQHVNEIMLFLAQGQEEENHRSVHAAVLQAFHI